MVFTSAINAQEYYYLDSDHDGYGNPGIRQTQPINGFVSNSSDPDDNNPCVPNISNCGNYHQDNDGDGFGASDMTYGLLTPTNLLMNALDCDDANAAINPNTIWYKDADNDTFGSTTVTGIQCLKPTTDSVLNKLDCNDSTNTITCTTWYIDDDNDGFGETTTKLSCTQPTGFVANNFDKCPGIKGTILGCIVPVENSNFSNDQNYIITATPQIPTTNLQQITDCKDVKVSITYFDGLGRPKQQIANAQSGTAKDIVTHIEYDSSGRQIKEYLPYASSQTSMAYTDGLTLKNGTISQYQAKYGDANPYSEKLLESSPLNRVLKQGAPGTDWGIGIGHEIKLSYQTNTVTDAVKRYTANATTPSLGVFNIALIDNGDYTINQLYKTITYDENSSATPVESAGSTIEFKNKEGQVVLKRTYDNLVKHDTYYVYDQYSNLTYVITPKADVAITQSILDDLCYQYKYDNRNRLVEKKLPGKQWEFIVYDKLDRVVATGPTFSPFSDSAAGVVGWMITKYDVFNRPIYTGWEQSTTVTSAGRTSKQNTMNGLTTISESKTATATTIDAITGVAYYSNSVVPTVFKLLTVNYYDDYNFFSFSPVIAYTAPVVYNNSSLKPKGLSTGSWVRVLTTLASTTAEKNYVLYDAKARPVRTFITNYLGGYTRIDNTLDTFSGKLNYTETFHKRLLTDPVDLYTKEMYTYTAQERIATHTHQIGTGGTPQLLAANTYDELGNLISKKVGNSEALPLQKVDYSYNIRAWLTEINKVATLQQGTDPKDLFGFKINYNKVEGDASVANKLFNGNIAETSWSTSTVVRTYGYKYDNLNRLKDATYQKAGLITNAYDENLTYDKNGNIFTLKRKGDTDPQIQTIKIDDLAYIYKSSSSNQLAKVSDNPITATSGFKDGTNTGDDYTYDSNGNLQTDQNKNITAITYNHLNLPLKVTFGTTGNITYIYNAVGQKVQKTVTVITPASTTITNYLGGFQYQGLNGVTPSLQFFPTAEGYVKNASGVYSYVFNYTDHLGNVRLSYSDSDKNGQIATTEILEESNYYPFGLKHNGYTGANLQPSYKYKFLGQERQDELGLNWDTFRYRNYDYTIGRFMGIDPITEEYMSISPYQFAHNNPVWKIELEGLEGKPTSGNDVINREPRVLAVFYHGGPTGDGQIRSNTSGTGGTGDRYNATAAYAKSQGRDFVGAIISPSATQGPGVETGKGFLEKNYQAGDQVIVYGYSYGGDNAVNLAEAVPNIPIDAMIIVDSSDGPLQGATVDTSIPNNVNTADVFYQENNSGASSSSRAVGSSSGATSSSGGSNSSGSSNRSNSGSSNSPGSRGYPHTSEGTAKVTNTKVSGNNVNHGNIQTKAGGNIQSAINKRIDGCN